MSWTGKLSSGRVQASSSAAGSVKEHDQQEQQLLDEIHCCDASTREEIVRALQKIAPLRLAQSWDNVGLLIEPSGERTIDTILLTNDLTEPVLREARAVGAQFIVAYHPPIFEALKRVTSSDAKQRIVRDCLEQGIAVYSPHTACDSADGGINDWLVRCLAVGSGAIDSSTLDAATAAVKTCSPLKVHSESTADSKVVVFVPKEHADGLRVRLSEAGAGVIGAYAQCSFGVEGKGTFVGDETTSPQLGQQQQLETVTEVRLEMVCPRSRLPSIATTLSRHHPYEEPAWDVYPLLPLPELCGTRPSAISERDAHPSQRLCGAGRQAVLSEPSSLHTLVERLKRAIQISRVRVAVGEGRSLEAVDCRSIAVAAGSGSSLLMPQAGKIDVLVSGEMGHHDVLAATARGSHVILCEHSNSERGYLRDVLQHRLLQELASASQVVVSQVDADPLVSM